MKELIKVPSSSDSAEFYDRLMEGSEKRGILGKANRFDPIRISRMRSVQKYFVEVVRPYIKPTDRVLDFGCGPGSFLIPISQFCKEVVGVDISANFVREVQNSATKLELKNVQAAKITPGQLPFEDNSFDVILMVDVIHHLDDIEGNLKEVFRVLKAGGRAIVYEPNKLNPLLYLVHLMDRNEWGLLKLGTPAKYRQILKPFIEIDELSFNGIVIGPESKAFHLAADLLNSTSLKPVLGWLNPKMFITGTKKA